MLERLFQQALNMKQKNLLIEILRIGAAFGIIYFHSGYNTGKSFAYGGLIFFIIITFYFSSITNSDNFIIVRFRKLLIPYLFWFIFYGLIKYFIKGQMFPDGYSITQKILCSPSIHLWFLPFTFFISVFFVFMVQYFTKSLFCTIIGLVGLVLLGFSPIWREWLLEEPYAQYIHAFPAACVGFFFGGRKVMGKNTWKFILNGYIIVIFTLAILRIPGVGISYSTGFLMSLVIFIDRDILSEKFSYYIMSISATSFGIYLIHPFLLSIGNWFGFPEITNIICTFLLSLFIVFILKLSLNKIKYNGKIFLKYIV